MIMQKITAILENRNLSLMELNKFGLISEIDDTIKQIKDDIGKQNNISNRSKIASQTKKINKLQEEIDYHNPNLDEFLEIPIHGMSVNYMYESYIYDGELRTRKSKAYKRWIENFPNYLIENIFSEIDLNKKTKLWLRFDAINNFDVDNMIKAIQDQITRILGFDDDNKIQLGSVEINKRVNNYSQGKIYVLLKNIK